jgi:NADH-quinone oxidoreductase subunit D
VLRLVLELDGEVVERCDPHIGLLHRGTEKLMETRTYLQNLPYFDRLDYVSPMCMEHGWCLAIERMTGVDDPAPRVAHPRDVQRDHAHQEPPPQRHDLGHGRGRPHAARCGASRSARSSCLLRARLGARGCHASYFRPGGVHQDLPPKLIDDIDAWASQFPRVLDDIDGLLAENRIFKQRNVGHRRS